MTVTPGADLPEPPPIRMASRVYELLLVRNYDLKRHIITLTIDFAADFADMFEVRGQSRARHGKHMTEAVGPNSVVLRYAGWTGSERTTSVCFSPGPNSRSHGSALYFRWSGLRVVPDRHPVSM